MRRIDQVRAPKSQPQKPPRSPGAPKSPLQVTGGAVRNVEELADSEGASEDDDGLDEAESDEDEADDLMGQAAAKMGGQDEDEEPWNGDLLRDLADDAESDRHSTASDAEDLCELPVRSDASFADDGALYGAPSALQVDEGQESLDGGICDHDEELRARRLSFTSAAKSKSDVPCGPYDAIALAAAELCADDDACPDKTPPADNRRSSGMADDRDGGRKRAKDTQENSSHRLALRSGLHVHPAQVETVPCAAEELPSIDSSSCLASGPRSVVTDVHSGLDNIAHLHAVSRRHQLGVVKSQKVNQLTATTHHSERELEAKAAHSLASHSGARAKVTSTFKNIARAAKELEAKANAQRVAYSERQAAARRLQVDVDTKCKSVGEKLEAETHAVGQLVMKRYERLEAEQKQAKRRRKEHATKQFVGLMEQMKTIRE